VLGSLKRVSVKRYEQTSWSEGNIGEIEVVGIERVCGRRGGAEKE